MWTPQRIKKLRDAFGQTQEQFSARLGMTKFGLRMWEQGQSVPSEMAQILLDRIEEDLAKGRVDKSDKQPA